MGLSKSSKIAREDREKLIKLQHKYENRITIAKHGKESLDAGDYTTALKRFTEYLLILAEVKKVREPYELKVQHFDPKTDLTEMMMVSHIFFEMARLYDAVPKFHADAQKCLNVFVHFSANQPYQVVNSELIRKSIKRTAYKNPEDFRTAYQQIFVQSKKCYIVTFCYGDQHPITTQFREFKDWLLEHSWGHKLIEQYYKYSSVSVAKYSDNFLFQSVSHFFVKPLLLLLSKIILPAILK